MNDEVKKVIERFEKGEIIIYPTDTQWGVGCLISNKESIDRLIQIKERETKPFTVLVPSIEKAHDYAFFSPIADKLAELFWPGPLTLVLEAKSLDLHPQLFGKNKKGTKTIALRMPNQELILEVLQKLPEGITGPSANFAGHRPPMSPAQMNKDFVSKADYIVHSDFEGMAQSSTIVEVHPNGFAILREGKIVKEQLVHALAGLVS